ncbi:MAG: hypothetical protein QOJ04_5305 [Caballeronia sp.]|jgi:hypothetical protein|nr:hypothetical protein [Caballeronia sp.]MEA3114826.1 hypothetical protein [Caballeronia sp.]
MLLRSHGIHRPDAKGQRRQLIIHSMDELMRGQISALF